MASIIFFSTNRAYLFLILYKTILTSCFALCPTMCFLFLVLFLFGQSSSIHIGFHQDNIPIWLFRTFIILSVVSVLLTDVSTFPVFICNSGGIIMIVWHTLYCFVFSCLAVVFCFYVRASAVKVGFQLK